MTKPFTAALTISALLFGAAALAHHEKHVADKPMPAAAKEVMVQKINVNYIQNVKPIFSAKCADCHGANTIYPGYYKIPLVKQLIDHDVTEGHEHLDISQDFPFIGHDGESSMTDNFTAIREVVSDGDMPPWRYTLLHPSTKLSPMDKQRILDWIAQSEATLK